MHGTLPSAPPHPLPAQLPLFRPCLLTRLRLFYQYRRNKDSRYPAVEPTTIDGVPSCCDPQGVQHPVAHHWAAAAQWAGVHRMGHSVGHREAPAVLFRCERTDRG